MDTFGFTRKKFLSISDSNQRRQIIDWLSEFYQQITTNRLSVSQMSFFIRQYNEILDWLGWDPFVPPGSADPGVWLETLSDRIHLHRDPAGPILRDTDLLPPVQTHDTPDPDFTLAVTDCHMALDGMRSLYNVGSLFRICEAAGLASLILGNTLGKNHPGVRKTAMGAEQWIQEERVTDLAGCLLEKKKSGYCVIGIETMPQSHCFRDYPWQDRTVLVLGNEEYGISSHVMKVCDDFVHIPMAGRKNSMNVAVAGGIVCFEMIGVLEQRRSLPKIEESEAGS